MFSEGLFTVICIYKFITCMHNIKCYSTPLAVKAVRYSTYFNAKFFKKQIFCVFTSKPTIFIVLKVTCALCLVISEHAIHMHS
jgi:hypothetical protein